MAAVGAPPGPAPGRRGRRDRRRRRLRSRVQRGGRPVRLPRARHDGGRLHGRRRRRPAAGGGAVPDPGRPESRRDPLGCGLDRRRRPGLRLRHPRHRESHVFGRELYVARLPIGDPANGEALQFWDGAEWQSDDGRARADHRRGRRHVAAAVGGRHRRPLGDRSPSSAATSPTRPRCGPPTRPPGRSTVTEALDVPFESPDGPPTTPATRSSRTRRCRTPRSPPSRHAARLRLAQPHRLRRAAPDQPSAAVPLFAQVPLGPEP